MKPLLLSLILLAGCVAKADPPPSPSPPSKSAQRSNVYIEHKAISVLDRYYPQCVRLCFAHTESSECESKCRKDMGEVLKVMVRAVKEGKEDDFDDLMVSWYEVKF